MAIKKGLGAIIEADRNSTARLKMEDGDSKLLRILTPVDEIISGWLYQINVGGSWKSIIQSLPKDECPIAKAGHKARFVSYVEVLDKDDDNRVKVWQISKTVGLQLKNIYEEYGSITDRDFKVKREGEELKTKYYFFPKDKEELDLKPLDEERINLEEYVRAMIFEKDELVAMMRGGEVTDNTSKEESANSNRYPF